MAITITGFSRMFTQMIAAESVKALEQVAKDNGVAVSYKGGKYAADGSNCTLQIEFAVINKSGVVQTKEATDFKNYASMYGLKPEDLGMTFISNNTRFKITGLSPRKHKMPILGVRLSDGRGFKFPAEQVKRQLEQSGVRMADPK